MTPQVKVSANGDVKKVEEPNVPPDPYPDYAPVYGWLFQAWLIMFLAVICASLVIYLLTFIPK